MNITKKMTIGCSLLVLLAAGCKCNEKQKAETAIRLSDSLQQVLPDSLQTTVHDFVLEDGANVFEVKSQQWIHRTLNNDKADWGDFVLNNMSSLTDDTLRTAFHPTKDFYAHYDSVLSWSPDSASLIDFGSYSMMPIVGAGGQMHLEGSDPDTRISLINEKANNQLVVLQGGPAMQILGVNWLNLHKAALLVADDGVANKTDTSLWIINLKDSTMRQYLYK